jgi:hypothetical protein
VDVKNGILTLEGAKSVVVPKKINLNAGGILIISEEIFLYGNYHTIHLYCFRKKIHIKTDPNFTGTIQKKF